MFYYYKLIRLWWNEMLFEGFVKKKKIGMNKNVEMFIVCLSFFIFYNCCKIRVLFIFIIVCKNKIK